MKDEAYSSDGYIVAQHHTEEVRYGRLPSSDNGCGWIAAFNLAKALGGAPSAEDLAARLAVGSPFKGMLGTGPRRLRRFIENEGIPLQTAFGRKRVMALSQQCHSGILLFRCGIYLHYVTFINAAHELPRFLNTTQNAGDIQMEMGEFLRNYVKLSFVHAMVSPL